MGIIIVSCVTLILVCILVTAAKLKEEKSRETTSHSVRVHGQDIYLDQKSYEEYRKKKADEEQRVIEEQNAEQEIIREEFKNLVSELKDKIYKSYLYCNDNIDKQVFNSLLQTEIKNETDYERLQFVYNDGKLRSNEEVNDYDWQIQCQKYRENFNTERHKVNIIAFFLPFTLTFTFFTALLWKSWRYISLLPSAFLAFIAGHIGMIVGYKINLSNAELYGIPKDDPAVKAERIKKTSAVIGGAVAAGSIIHHTKSAVKDITNVDGWKEMK